MTWFALQSAIMLLLAFVLGALVGYWYWRTQYRRVAFTESEAVTVISRRHEKVLAEKDAEIGRLQGLVAGGAGAAVLADGDHLSTGSATDADAAPDAATADSADVTADATADVTAEAAPVADEAPAAEVSPVVDEAHADDDADEAADVVDATDEADGTPATDEATAVQEATAADEAPVADEAPAADEATAADAPAVEVIEVPDSEPETGTVVDVTDGALAADGTDDAGTNGSDADPGADSDAAARAVAQLPTQGSPEPVIDLSDTAAATDDAPADTDDTGSSDDAPAAAPAEADAPVAAGVATGLLGATAAADAEEEDTVADDGVEDDLERIEGIGPRIASALRTSGIRSFRRLADADVPTLQAALEAAGLRFAPSLPTWSRQARFLADGDEVGFIKLTESLVAGREPGRSR